MARYYNHDDQLDESNATKFGCLLNQTPRNLLGRKLLTVRVVVRGSITMTKGSKLSRYIFVTLTCSLGT